MTQRPLLIVLGLFWLLSAASLVTAQDEPAGPPAPIPTPVISDNIDLDPAAGLLIYQQRCATCHGEAGLGDGPQAAQSIQPPTPIGDPAYLRTADPAYMFNIIQNGNLLAGMPGFGAGNNSNPLDTADIWNVIGAIYALPELNEPLDTAVVRGQLTNATTGEAVGDVTVILQAFTPDAVEALRLETMADTNGNYQFDLSRIPPTWLYRTVASYGELDFSSDFTRLSRQEPAVELPISIYETTSDPAVIRFAELDAVLDFLPDTLRVSELYLISNESNEVFVGADGTAESVTVAFTVPDEATGVQFLRGGATANDFSPLDEQITPLAGNEYGLTVPIPPGEGVARVLVQYELPFAQGMTIARPVAFPLDRATVIVPNAGISLDEGGAWQQVSSESASLSEDIKLYQHPAVAQGEVLALTLAGFPTAVADSQGNLVIVRNEQQELWIGVFVLLVTAVVVGFVGYRWTQSQPSENEQDVLIQTLVALDEAYAAQEIRKSSYERKRRAIKEQLLAIWQDEPS